MQKMNRISKHNANIFMREAWNTEAIFTLGVKICTKNRKNVGIWYTQICWQELIWLVQQKNSWEQCFLRVSWNFVSSLQKIGRIFFCYFKLFAYIFFPTKSILLKLNFSVSFHACFKRKCFLWDVYF